MKKLILKTTQFEHLQLGYKEWLETLGYHKTGVYNMPHIIREFLFFLEGRNVFGIKQLSQEHTRAYYDYLQQRGNQRRGGALSDKYILMQMQALEKFLEYLRHIGVHDLDHLGVRLTSPKRKEVCVLSKEEVKSLFEAVDKQEYKHQLLLPIVEHLKNRDRAMLVVYYSCGLRRNEGVHLEIEDINFDTQVIHVKKGKGNKERFVPFTKADGKLLEQYIYDSRIELLKGRKSSFLFISVSKNPKMDGGSLYKRLKHLQLLSNVPTLKEKEIGLHTLRHSIATHLLQSGMSLEKIARFLGHSTMDSTQVYTHLVEENDGYY